MLDADAGRRRRATPHRLVLYRDAGVVARVPRVSPDARRSSSVARSPSSRPNTSRSDRQCRPPFGEVEVGLIARVMPAKMLRLSKVKSENSNGADPSFVLRRIRRIFDEIGRRLPRRRQRIGRALLERGGEPLIEGDPADPVVCSKNASRSGRPNAVWPGVPCLALRCAEQTRRVAREARQSTPAFADTVPFVEALFGSAVVVVGREAASE